MAEEPRDPMKNDVREAPGVTIDEREELVPDLLARRFAGDSRSYGQIVWHDFKTHRIAYIALWLMLVMGLIAVFVPMIANHRPFVLYVPEAVHATLPPNSAAEPGWQFPLFAALRPVDWVLIIGLFQALAGYILVRRARSLRRPPRAGGVTVLLALGLAPLIAAPIVSERVRAAFRDQDAAGENAVVSTGAGTGPLGLEYWIWGALAIALTLGLFWFITGLRNLYTERRDVLGNLLTGSSVLRVFFGSVFILIPASMIGTLGQRAQDTTDYHSLSQRDGVIAVFAPVQHDYRASESFLKHQEPFGPRLSVQASGGSLAATDLGLTKERQQASLLNEVRGPDGSTPDALTRETPVAWLRNGQGMRSNADDASDFALGPDFNIITAGVDRIPVRLGKVETIGDVIDRINAAAAPAAEGTSPVIEASISDDGRRIVFNDDSSARPVNFMGTDKSGSDVAARIVQATRVALSIGFVSTSIALLIGITAGALMGYFGGIVDIIGMRIIEIFMAIPRLFLLLTVIAFIPPEWNEYMLYAMMAVIGMFSWMSSARFIRAEFFRLRDQDFIQSAKACGLPLRSVLFKHMLPNGVTPVLVDASFAVAAAIFIETGLSFLGFGIKPPEPSWGQMLADAVDPTTGVFYWWLAIFPGVMIFITVFAFNLIGDAMRDAIDPKLKKAAH